MSIPMRFGYATLMIGCGSQPEWGHKREHGAGHMRGYGNIRGFTKCQGITLIHRAWLSPMSRPSGHLINIHVPLI